MVDGAMGMTSGNKHTLEAISVRRAQVADADKVRYRVYTSPTEFMAVIAESALMAVKVSGVKTPFKIMRDLPTDGIAIEAKKMAEIDPGLSRVAMRLHPDEEKGPRFAEMPEASAKPAGPFVPMGIADLRAKGGNRVRILPAEMVNQIIEEHAKAQQPKEELPAEEHETVLISEPEELSPAEKLSQMASEMPAAEPETLSDPNAGLSKEEVEKLLNG